MNEFENKIIFDEYSGKPQFHTKFNTYYILNKYMNYSDEDRIQNELLRKNEIRRKKIDSL